LLDWIKSVKPNLHRWSLKELNHRPSAYLIDEEDQNCHELILESRFKEIVENELLNLYIDRELWPQNIDYELFLKWYTYQYHEEIYDFSSKNIEVFDE